MAYMSNLRKIAALLYGPGQTDLVYIEALAADLHVSFGGVKKWWYYEREVPDSALLTLSLLRKSQSS